MKKTLLFCVLSGSLAFAQTIVTKAFNDPNIGDTYNTVIVNGVNGSVAGNPVTFSFPSVTTGSSAVSTYSAPSSDEVTTYPGTTIKHSDGNVMTILYKQSSNKVEITGLITTTPDYYLNLNFAADNATTITYPTAYGFTGTDTAKGTFIANIGNSDLPGFFKGDIATNAEGYGTLQIGSQTISDVLKIKVTFTFTLYLDATYLFSVGTMTNSMYLYYDAAHKFPLLTYTEGNIKVPLANMDQNIATALGLSDIFLGTENANLKPNFVFYPNPTKDIVKFDSSKNYQNAKIYNLEGRQVKSAALKTNQIDISDLKSGNYIIILTDGNGNSQTMKIIKN